MQFSSILNGTERKKADSNLGPHVAGFAGDQVAAGPGDVDAVDRVGVPGEEGLLAVAPDGPGHDARTQRVEGSETVR